MRRLTQWLSVVLVAGGVALVGGADAGAVELYFALKIDNIIDGVNYDRDDVIKYDTGTGDASLFFDGDTVFNQSREGIDALYIFPNGDLLLSTVGNAAIGGLNFKDEDLVRVNPVTHDATLFFDGSEVFKKNEDLRAIDVLADGRLVFASTSGEIDGLTFSARDLVAYDPLTDDASLFFDGSEHFGNKKGAIGGVDVLDDGRLVLIIQDADGQAELGGVKIGRRDIVLYDPSTKMLEKVLVNGDDIFERVGHTHDQGFTAVHVPGGPVVPEPMSSALFGVGLAGLGAWRSRRRTRRSG